MCARTQVPAKFARDSLGIQVSAAELAADKDRRRPGEAFADAMKSTKLSDVDSQPERVVITDTVVKQGDPSKKTQTETYTVYQLTVFAPDGEEWTLEPRFSAFR